MLHPPASSTKTRAASAMLYSRLPRAHDQLTVKNQKCLPPSRRRVESRPAGLRMETKNSNHLCCLMRCMSTIFWCVLTSAACTAVTVLSALTPDAAPCDLASKKSEPGPAPPLGTPAHASSKSSSSSRSSTASSTASSSPSGTSGRSAYMSALTTLSMAFATRCATTCSGECASPSEGVFEPARSDSGVVAVDVGEFWSERTPLGLDPPPFAAGVAVEVMNP
mmetsp:Transcript_4845/g.19731  ORF Transcript_4845/g.19731 Transcript_4845/m.19731 type:complete len:222 (-) Transcript_4845:355-1020(-)